VTSPESLESITNIWMKEIKGYAAKNPTIVLVGNKTDLRHTMNMKPEVVERMNSMLQDIKDEFAKDGVVDVVEVSSKSGQHVGRAFETLVDAILKRKGRDSLNPNSSNKKILSKGERFTLHSDSPPSGFRKYLCCNLL